MKAALYIRVSTEEQAIKGYSVPEQIDACTQKAKELGATEFIVFCEEAESGAFIDRPELEKMFNAVEFENIKLVVALDTDRLARDLYDQIAIANAIEKSAKLDFVFYSRGDPKNPEDNLFFHIKGAFAQYERAKIKQRTSFGRKRKALLGKVVMPGGWAGHPGPYGYKNVKNDNGSKFEIIEKEAEIIRYIYDLAYTEKYGIMRIVDVLNRGDKPSPKGGIWHSSTVGRILKNEMYAGFFHNFKFRTQMTNERTLRGKRRIHRETRPLSERILVEVPAIIDREVWEAVQKSLRDNRSKNQKVGTFFLLKGRVKCGYCGRTCSAETSGKVSPLSNARRSYYRCKGTKTGIYPKCNLPSIASINNSKNPGLDDLVWSEIVRVLNDYELIKSHLNEEETAIAIQTINDKITQLQAQLSGLGKHKDELFSLRMEGLLTSEELKKRLLKLEQKKKSIENSLNEATNSLNSIKTNTIDPIEFCEFFQTRINDASNEIKTQVVNDLDIKVIIYSSRKFEVYWPFADMTTGNFIESEEFTGSMPLSMTPGIKESLHYYCSQNNITEAEAIRRAIRLAPIDSNFTKRPRGNRIRTTITVTQKDIKKVLLLQQTYKVSISQAIEWALEVFFKS